MARRGVLVGGLGVLGAAVCAGWLLKRPDDPPRTAGKALPTPVRPAPIGTGRQVATLSGHTWAVGPVSFGAGGEVLASASIDAGHVWDVTTRRATATFTADAGEVAPGPVAFSPDGDILAIVQDRETVRLWHRADGETLRTITAPGLNGYSVIFSPDGTTLAAPSRNAILLWDVATGRATATLTDPKDANCGVAFAPDGRTLATGGNDGAVRLWSPTEHKVVRTLADPDGDGITAIAFGGSVAVADRRGVRLWNVATGRATTLTGDQWVNAMAFSPDQRSLATVAQGTAKLWDLRSRRAITVFTGVSSVAFSPDGTTLATGDRAGTIRLWKL